MSPLKSGRGTPRHNTSFHLVTAVPEVAGDKSWSSVGFAGCYVHMFLPSEVIAHLFEL